MADNEFKIVMSDILLIIQLFTISYDIIKMYTSASNIVWEDIAIHI